ncbi:MAG: transposase [candidate division Zixibacteria bacterium]|nr:transposase [Candidatus Tariuqbacter arcticus]
MGNRPYNNLHITAIDEITIRKRHIYLTVIIDLETGHIVWAGKGRSKATLDTFFRKMPIMSRHNLC